MKTLKRSILTAAGLGAGCLTLLILTPKAAHGVVAALVQVVNTPANPVPIQNIDEGARSPVQVSRDFGLGATATGCASMTVYSVPPSPSRRLVIEVVSFNADSSNSENGATLDVTTTAGGTRATHRFGSIPVPFGFFTTRGVHWVINQPSVRLYADPGTDVTAQECVQNVPISIPTISLSGYFVSLP